MGVPARDSAAAREPADPDKHDPRARGWADVQQIIITDSGAIRLAVEDVRRAVEDVRRAVAGSGKLDAALEKLDAAVAMNGLTVDVMNSALVIGRRWVVDDAHLAAERRRGFDEGYAACRAARYRLEVVDGGQAAPGPR